MSDEHDLEVTDSTFSHNKASFEGGAIYLAGSGDISSTTFTGNEVETPENLVFCDGFAGGALFVQSSFCDLSFDDVQFVENYAPFGPVAATPIDSERCWQVIESGITATGNVAIYGPDAWIEDELGLEFDISQINLGIDGLVMETTVVHDGDTIPVNCTE